MKNPLTTPLSARLDARLLAYATIATAAGTAMTAVPAHATVITSGPLNLAVPMNIDGIYLNLATGASSTSSFTGYDFNPYFSSSNTLLSFLFPSNAGTGGLAVGGVYAVLSGGAVIGPSGTFLAGVQSGTAMANFRAGSTGYLGIAFLNETTSATDYGYIHFTSGSPNGSPATIVDYAYDNTGAAITIPVPEPSTLGLLGVIAIGAVGIRLWRQRQSA